MDRRRKVELFEENEVGPNVSIKAGPNQVVKSSLLLGRPVRVGKTRIPALRLICSLEPHAAEYDFRLRKGEEACRRVGTRKGR
jgi:hypothetical protein